MREAEIERKVCNYARTKGWMAFKFVSPSNRGVPDRLFIHDGVFFFVEFKRKGGKPTTLQKVMMKRIEAQGVKCYVIDDVEEGIALVNANTL